MEGARLAAVTDVDNIVSIGDQHRKEIADQRGADLLLRQEGLTASGLAQLIRDDLGRDDALVVVGTYDDVVFGYSRAQVETLADGGSLMVLSDFIVERQIRKSGIGEAMMNFVLQQAQSRRCIGIDSRALPGDRDTKNFFESFGLKARMLTVHRSIDDS